MTNSGNYSNNQFSWQVWRSHDNEKTWYSTQTFVSAKTEQEARESIADLQRNLQIPTGPTKPMLVDWKTYYCHHYEKNGGFYADFSLHPKTTRCYGDSKDTIYEVNLAQCEESEDAYWAWWDNERGSFPFVYNKRFLVEMCFAYGTKPEEERGRGKLIPVKVIAIGEYHEKEPTDVRT